MESLITKWEQLEETKRKDIRLLPKVWFRYMQDIYHPCYDPSCCCTYVHHQCLPCLLCSRNGIEVLHPCIADLDEKTRFDTDVRRLTCDRFHHEEPNFVLYMKVNRIFCLWELSNSFIYWIPEEVVHSILLLFVGDLQEPFC
jgi:hypothetical protein